MLHFAVNGASLGDLDVSSNSADGWQQMTGTYKATVSGAATLAIADTNNSVPFNDFALDDISFTSAASGTPEPASWALLLAGFGAIGGVMRRRAANVRVAA